MALSSEAVGFEDFHLNIVHLLINLNSPPLFDQKNLIALLRVLIIIVDWNVPLPNI